MKPKKEQRGSFIVTMECTVKKNVTVSGCTQEEAENNPWDYAIDEVEIEQSDYRVLRVEENK